MVLGDHQLLHSFLREGFYQLVRSSIRSSALLYLQNQVHRLLLFLLIIADLLVLSRFTTLLLFQLSLINLPELLSVSDGVEGTLSYHNSFFEDYHLICILRKVGSMSG